MAKKQVLVVGAGVVGLTTALELHDRLGDSVEVSLVSKDLPGDSAVFYTSPKAGAHWISSNTKEHKDWALATYHKLRQLADVPQAFVQAYPLYYGDIVPAGHTPPRFVEPWYKDEVDGYRYLGTDPRFPDVQNLFTFTSYTISTTLYLVYLLSELRQRGVAIRRQTLASLDEALHTPLPSGAKGTADLVVNCTGLQYNFLADGGDAKLAPVRGHVLVVENNLPYQVTFEQPYIPADAKDGEFLMLFPRPEGGAILGGIYDRDFLEYDTALDQAYVARLVAKAQRHLPELVASTGGTVKIARHVIGFRPERQGGARIGVDPANSKVVHNYGNGNSGFIESWGCAANTARIIGDTLFASSKL